MTLKNRYDFVLLFDVKDGNRMVIRMLAICRVWTRKPDMD